MTADDLQVVEIISAAISLTVLIVFFVLSRNVFLIKEAIKGSQKEHHQILYEKALIAGDKTGAYDALLYLALFDLARLETGSDNEGDYGYERLKEKYAKPFEDLQKEFPANPF